MANKVWADWFDDVLPSLPGMSLAMATILIREAAIEWCDRSLCWRVAIPAFASVANQGPYPIAAPVAGTEVAKVLELRWLGIALTPATPAQLAARFGNQDWRAATALAPSYFTEERPQEVTLVGKPTTLVAAAISGWAAVKPTDVATGLDELIWREYRRDIARLAKAHAMDQNKKPWTDKPTAKSYFEETDHRIGLTALKMAKGGGGAMRTMTHWT
jgi:hypothetical protein